MNKVIYSLAIALVLGTTGALAGGRDETPVSTTSQTQGQGQVQGQLQGQGQAQAQQAEANATGIGTGIANSKSSSGAISGSSSDAVSGSASGAISGSYSEGGDSYAQGGNSYSKGGNSQVGDTRSKSQSASNSGGNSQGVSVDASDNSQLTYIDETAAASAATVFAQVCQNGGSAQGLQGGFSVSNQDVLCEHLKMAAVMREAYNYELYHGQEVCGEPMSIDHQYDGAMYADTCFNEKAMKYYDSYHEHMDDAMRLIDKTEEAGFLDKMAGYLIRPLALVGALVFFL